MEKDTASAHKHCFAYVIRLSQLENTDTSVLTVYLFLTASINAHTLENCKPFFLLVNTFYLPIFFQVSVIQLYKSKYFH